MQKGAQEGGGTPSGSLRDTHVYRAAFCVHEIAESSFRTLCLFCLTIVRDCIPSRSCTFSVVLLNRMQISVLLTSGENRQCRPRQSIPLQAHVCEFDEVSVARSQSEKHGEWSHLQRPDEPAQPLSNTGTSFKLRVAAMAESCQHARSLSSKRPGLPAVTCGTPPLITRLLVCRRPLAIFLRSALASPNPDHGSYAHHASLDSRWPYHCHTDANLLFAMSWGGVRMRSRLAIRASPPSF